MTDKYFEDLKNFFIKAKENKSISKALLNTAFATGREEDFNILIKHLEDCKLLKEPKKPE